MTPERIAELRRESFDCQWSAAPEHVLECLDEIVRLQNETTRRQKLEQRELELLADIDELQATIAGLSDSLVASKNMVISLDAQNAELLRQNNQLLLELRKCQIGL